MECPPGRWSCVSRTGDVTPTGLGPGRGDGPPQARPPCRRPSNTSASNLESLHIPDFPTVPCKVTTLLWDPPPEVTTSSIPHSHLILPLLMPSVPAKLQGYSLTPSLSVFSQSWTPLCPFSVPTKPLFHDGLSTPLSSTSLSSWYLYACTACSWQNSTKAEEPHIPFCSWARLLSHQATRWPH